jgi:hypothetical protein
MRFSSRLLTGMTAATAAVVVAAPGAAFAAPAKKTPVLTVKVSSGSIVVGHVDTITPTLHLPAKDKLKSYTITFADGSKSTGSSKGVKLPKNWKHTYKKALSGKVTVTVKDTLKHTYSATAAIKVTNPPVVTPPLPPAPPAPPAYVAPTGIFSGHVSSQGVALAGIAVSVMDDDTGALDAAATTDSHGNWAVASLPAASSVDGYDIVVNSTDGVDSANPAYNVGADNSVTPATTSAYSVDLPPVSAVTGSIVGPGGSLPPADTVLVACVRAAAGGCSFEQVGTISGNTYSIPLGIGMSWRLDALSFSTDEVAGSVVTPAGSSFPGPALTMSGVPATDVAQQHAAVTFGARASLAVTG